MTAFASAAAAVQWVAELRCVLLSRAATASSNAVAWTGPFFVLSLDGVSRHCAWLRVEGQASLAASVWCGSSVCPRQAGSGRVCGWACCCCCGCTLAWVGVASPSTQLCARTITAHANKPGLRTTRSSGRVGWERGPLLGQQSAWLLGTWGGLLVAGCWVYACVLMWCESGAGPKVCDRCIKGAGCGRRCEPGRAWRTPQRLPIRYFGSRGSGSLCVLVALVAAARGLRGLLIHTMSSRFVRPAVPCVMRQLTGAPTP
jgi:hypothetical protein